MKPAINLKKLVLRSLPVAMALVMTVWAFPSAIAMIGSSQTSAFYKNSTAGSEISFSSGDFAEPGSGSELDGIVITSLPDPAVGSLRLGTRQLMTGEAVAVESIGMLRFVPSTEDEVQATFNYMPVYTSGVSVESVTVGINLLKEENKAPSSEDIELVTYRNVATGGSFRATDPEGDKLTFRVTKKPSRGEVELLEEGVKGFKYTPYKNKTGNDSFTYVAVDVMGNESHPTTVSIKIEKTSCKVTYADMEGSGAHYAAIRLTEAGVLTGQKLGSQYFFEPDQPITRGEFVAMAVTALGSASSISPVSRTGFADDSDTPDWLKPYASTALKNGVIRGITVSDGSRVFRSKNVLTRGEAAVILNNSLRISDTENQSAFADADSIPTWAYQATVNTEAAGIVSTYGDGTIRVMDQVTRGEAAQMLVNAMDEKASSEKGGGLLSWLW